jgi:inhibitor of KinA sporulation pathway (predicted exonuclease)
MDKPLATGRDNTSGAKATTGQFHTKKAPSFDHHWVQHFIFLQPFDPHTNGHLLINFDKDKSSFNTSTTLENWPYYLEQDML